MVQTTNRGGQQKFLLGGGGGGGGGELMGLFPLNHFTAFVENKLCNWIVKIIAPKLLSNIAPNMKLCGYICYFLSCFQFSIIVKKEKTTS